jgi:alpha-glucosidase
MESRSAWWDGGVVYQAYPRSFQDSDGDGHGDLAGARRRLGYLAWLGVDAVWLNPITCSPNRDWGYDVSDYTAVQPDLGTLADAERLVVDAHGHGLRVLFDLVPSHTSIDHPWFADARAGGPHRDWYVWRPGRSAGEPPNNWLSFFGGPAWTYDAAVGAWYAHRFRAEQPDLDWHVPVVRDEFDRIMRFWYARGVDGFRIDVCHGLLHDRGLRDNPPARAGDPERVLRYGQWHLHDTNQPELPDIFRRWRAVADAETEPRVLAGELGTYEPSQLRAFFGAGDALHLSLDFPFQWAHGLDAEWIAATVARVAEAVPGCRGVGWQLSSHDASRFPTRLCQGDPARVGAALTLLMTLPGTPVLYQGDELGMTDREIPDGAARDTCRIATGRPGRDGARTPMIWSDAPGGGFTEPGVEPWLPLGATASSVERQATEPRSALSLTRRLLALRRATPALRRGGYRLVRSDAQVLVYARDGIGVALNLSERPARAADLVGRVVCDSHGTATGAVDGVTLAPWQALVVKARDAA